MILSEALKTTAKKRNTESMFNDYKSIIETIRVSEQMADYWSKYQKDFDYAKEISFDEVLDVSVEILDRIID